MMCDRRAVISSVDFKGQLSFAVRFGPVWRACPFGVELQSVGVIFGSTDLVQRKCGLIFIHFPLLVGFGENPYGSGSIRLELVLHPGNYPNRNSTKIF